MVDAGRALDVLANQHNGHAARCNSRTMLIGNHGRYQHDAIDRVVLEQVEVLELTLGNVVGVGEQHLIPAATKHLANACGNSAHRLGVNLRHDDTDELGRAGTQGTSLVGPHIAGLLDRLFNALGLISRDISTVEIARNRGVRNTRQLGDILHLYHEYPRR